MQKATELKLKLDSIFNEKSVKVSPTTDLNKQTFLNAHDLIILGIKPLQLTELLLANPALKMFKGEILSTLAGVSLDSLKRSFPNASIINRIMPSIVSSEQRSTAVFFSSSSASLQNSIGALWYQQFGDLEVVNSDEELDELTLIFGSNAAYMSALILPWIKYLQKFMPLDRAKKLMISQWQQGLSFLENKDLLEVIDKVKTPKGITAAALQLLEQAQYEKIVEEAITLSSDRAKEVGELVSHALKTSSPDHN